MSVQGIKQKVVDRVRLKDDYHATFEGASGQNVLRHLCRAHFLGSSTFVAGSPDMTAFNEGRRYVVASILKVLGRDTAQLIETIEDQHGEE